MSAPLKHSTKQLVGLMSARCVMMSVCFVQLFLQIVQSAPILAHMSHSCWDKPVSSLIAPTAISRTTKIILVTAPKVIIRVLVFAISVIHSAMLVV